MRTNRISILLVCFAFYSLSLVAQEETLTVYDELETALQEPGKVQKYYLDCSIENDSLVFSTLNKFPNLKSLTIVGYEKSRFPANLFTSGKFTRLCLSECYDLDFKSFFKDLTPCKKLTSLLIDECDLTLIPPELSQLSVLEKVIITNCDNLDLANSINNLATCKALRYLGLPVNQICEIPLNINQLNKLEVLDISNNVLIDLPEGMTGLTSLQTFNTEGNLFENPVETLARVGSLQIKYLSIDNDMSESELSRLKQIFPLATIERKTAEGDLVIAPNNSSRPGGTEDTIAYGTFHQTSENMVLSDAYLHYPEIFRGFLTNFDSLLFDERYNNPDYANVYRITGTQWNSGTNSIRLCLWRRKHSVLKNKEIVFNFYRAGDAYNELTRSYNKELMAFRGLCWVYSGDLNKKEFKKKFIAKNHRNRPSENCFNDCRISYDDIAKTFTLELKNRQGFESFTAYPIPENSKFPESAKDQYAKRYYRYLNSLDSRRRRFNKRLLKDKTSYHKNKDKTYKSLWRSFSENYLSATEKKMTPDEWLTYYDWIVAHEKQAYDGAPVTVQLLQRYFYLYKYINNINVPDIIFDTVSSRHLINFVDASQLRQAVRDIIIVNTLQRMYLWRQGSLGVAPNELSLGKSPNICLILFLRSGNIGVVNQQDYSRIISASDEQEVKIEIFDKNLLTFGQLKQMLGL